MNEDDTWVTGLYSDGGLSSNGCSLTLGSRPAFLLHSDYVVEPENSLASFTTKELVEELYNRTNN